MRYVSKKTMTVRAALIVLACASLSACVEVGIPAGDNTTWGELNPVQDMHSSPAYKAQEPQPQFGKQPDSMRVPPPATVPVSYSPDILEWAPQETQLALKNPVPINAETLRYGQLAFNTTCIVCHGPDGQGHGYVVGKNKFPNPPSLMTQRARNFTDAHIYHVITHGQARMWSYKSQLYPIERWAIINYLRVLQRAYYPEPQDQQLVSEK